MNGMQPNSDTIYPNARITPGDIYRLRGKVCALRIFKMGQFEATTPGKDCNDFHVTVDGDGVFEIVFSANDPAVPNRLDTAGYPGGVIEGRWTDYNSQPVPLMTKVALKRCSRFTIVRDSGCDRKLARTYHLRPRCLVD